MPAYAGRSSSSRYRAPSVPAFSPSRSTTDLPRQAMTVSISGMALGYPRGALGSTRRVTTAIVIVVVVLLLLLAAALLYRSRRPDPAQRRVEARARLAE